MNKKRNILTTAVLFAIGLTVIISSCKKDDPDPVMVATSIELVSGGSQTDFTEATLADAIEVMVKDQEGNAFAGEVVNFAVAGGSVSAATVTTNASGKASVTWTLGTTEGTQTLTVTGTSTLTGSPLSITATAEYKPVIGDFKYGGVIFYIDNTGKSGLVCAVTDQSTGTSWGCSGTVITGADGTAVGTGEQNTIDIEAECTTAGTAADLCANLTLNSYSDWFLPGKDALDLIYQNRANINTTATANSGTNLEAAYYWCSSENSDVYAWIQQFSNGDQETGSKGFIGGHVRAVRAF